MFFLICFLFFSCSKENEVVYAPSEKVNAYVLYEEGLKSRLDYETKQSKLQETQAKVAFEKFSGLKINEYISNERVLLLDPKGIPLSSTTKELAIKAAEIAFLKTKAKVSKDGKERLVLNSSD